MSNTNGRQLSPSDLETLEYLSNLLQLFNHRNKNQHRRNIWWRHFSTFRRNLSETIREHEELIRTPTTHLERTRKQTRQPGLEIRLSQRLILWQNVLVPKWHNSFSQLVADGRFAVLGIVLLAILSQACAILGLVAAYDELGQDEIEKVISDFGKEYWGEGNTPKLQAQQEDVGEIVIEEDEGISLAKPLHSNAAAETKSVVPKKRAGTTSKNDSRRKKAKKGSAIDDLFSGLG
jgi:ribonuclease MRP protein subunit RMP1